MWQKYISEDAFAKMQGRKCKKKKGDSRTKEERAQRQWDQLAITDRTSN